MARTKYTTRASVRAVNANLSWMPFPPRPAIMDHVPSNFVENMMHIQLVKKYYDIIVATNEFNLQLFDLHELVNNPAPPLQRKSIRSRRRPSVKNTSA